jgi:hypothetical protein
MSNNHLEPNLTPLHNIPSEKKEKYARGALFVPAGLFIGFGFGFVTNNIPAGTFIGLGFGFAAFAIASFKRV